MHKTHGNANIANLHSNNIATIPVHIPATAVGLRVSLTCPTVQVLFQLKRVENKLTSSYPARAIRLNMDMRGKSSGNIQKQRLYILALSKVRRSHGKSTSWPTTDMRPDVESA